MIHFPDPLIDSLARRRCIPYLGAGVSKHAVSATGARPPDWKEFLEIAYDRCPDTARKKSHIKKLLKNGDFLSACQILKLKLDEEWPHLLDECFSTPAYSAGEIHKIIYDLDCSTVLTTNFDRIYDVKAGELSNGSVSTKSFQDSDLASIARGTTISRTILKIHGSLNDKNKMVFTREDFGKYRSEYSGFFKIFESLLITNAFLFIGSSFNDPDLTILLENYSSLYPGTAPHYALMPKGFHKDILGIWRKNYSVKVIEYNPKNNHAELLEIMKNLQEKVELKRQEMGNKLIW